MELLVVIAHISVVEVVLCNTNNVLSLQNNNLGQNKNNNTHTFNLLSPIKQHHFTASDGQQFVEGVTYLGDKYHQIASKFFHFHQKNRIFNVSLECVKN